MTPYPKFNPADPPPPLMAGQPDSFARWTMTTRIPAVVQTVLADYGNRYPPRIIKALNNLHREVAENGPVRPLKTTAPDGPDWQQAWQPYQGRRWLDLPWYFAEVFFYRRLLEAAGYFGADGWAGVDPFLPRKQAELQAAATWQAVEAALHSSRQPFDTGFRALLHQCLWGNRVDLSYTHLAQTARGHITVESEQTNLLVDDTAAVLAHLRQAQTGSSIHFICDNAGTELLMDLILADFLLGHNRAGRVVLHVKAHPTYVSDTTPADVKLTVGALKTRPAEMAALARRLETWQQEDRLHIEASRYWNSHYFFWDMPPDLHTRLGRACLVIIKGDANYRRLVGDSLWPPETPLGRAVPYFPAPFVALRTMKSDPVVGLQPGQAQMLDGEDPKWRVNGRRGVIQALLQNF